MTAGWELDEPLTALTATAGDLRDDDEELPPGMPLPQIVSVVPGLPAPVVTVQWGEKQYELRWQVFDRELNVRMESLPKQAPLVGKQLPPGVGVLVPSLLFLGDDWHGEEADLPGGASHQAVWRMAWNLLTAVDQAVWSLLKHYNDEMLEQLNRRIPVDWADLAN